MLSIDVLIALGKRTDAEQKGERTALPKAKTPTAPVQT